MFGDGKTTTPESFGNWLADVLVGKIAPVIKQAMKEQPDRPTPQYTVLRQTSTGPVPQQTSLPQMLAELTDVMRVQSYFSSEQLKVDVETLKEIKALTTELKLSRKLAKKMALENEEEDE